MKVTIKDIAEKSGVSVTTVSLILNNKRVRTSVATKAKVLQVARELNYVPNSLAVGLITKRTNTIGLIVPDISNVFFSQMAKCLEKLLAKRGYALFLCDTNDSDDEQAMYLKLMRSHRIDALVLCIANDTDKSLDQLEAFKNSGIPIVAFDRFSETMNAPLVATDNVESAKNIVQHIIDQGHRRIACISGPCKRNYSSRLDGYKQALAANGIPCDDNLVMEGDYRYDSGYECAKQLLKQQPTAIFACNDMMAYGVYKAVEEYGLTIPNDISVVGFDDLMFSSTLSVPLTTVRQDVNGMCEKIYSLVCDAIDGKHTNEKFVFTATPIFRNSVKNIK